MGTKNFWPYDYQVISCQPLDQRYQDEICRSYIPVPCLHNTRSRPSLSFQTSKMQTRAEKAVSRRLNLKRLLSFPNAQAHQ